MINLLFNKLYLNNIPYVNFPPRLVVPYKKLLIFNKDEVGPIPLRVEEGKLESELKSESELESIYIQLISLQGTKALRFILGSILNYKK